MNPRQIKISPEVYASLDKFCSKHGFIKKAITEQALLEYLSKLQEKLLK